MNKRVMFSALAILLVLPLLMSCTSQANEQPLEEVTVQLAWVHRALFAGFYAADQNGYYAEEGLKVNLVPRPSPEADILSPVVNGSAGFGVEFGASLIIARSQGLPVTAIATIYRRHPLVFMTLESSGITKPQDFPGHTIRTLVQGSSQVAFQAMMTKLGLDPESVRQVDVGYDLSPFYQGKLDIWPGFMNSEVLDARNKGYQVNLILPEDYGVHLNGYTLYTTDQMIEKNPDLVLRFLRASLRGWQWAIENPEEAGALALKYDPSLDESQQAAIMEASVPLIHTGVDKVGWIRPEIWSSMYEILSEQNLLGKPFDVNQTYTLVFLQKVYAGE
jgi:ABC-type nitrate/sulfonate/bicarbonate transport system substrate-binding protein